MDLGQIQIQIHFFFLTQTKDLYLGPLNSKFMPSKQTIKVIMLKFKDLHQINQVFFHVFVTNTQTHRFCKCSKPTCKFYLLCPWISYMHPMHDRFFSKKAYCLPFVPHYSKFIINTQRLFFFFFFSFFSFSFVKVNNLQQLYNLRLLHFPITKKKKKNLGV